MPIHETLKTRSGKNERDWIYHLRHTNFDALNVALRPHIKRLAINGEFVDRGGDVSFGLSRGDVWYYTRTDKKQVPQADSYYHVEFKDYPRQLENVQLMMDMLAGEVSVLLDEGAEV